ncbi:efflux RND transporter periplasmic adaptor subunit [Chitinivorax sp. B]|uniref:efflux RND transporter periplasmic adaptor subunit n=1 Tax=Chitinivorax sp. B TaxID=2502235 RepID=UPI0014851041|nr:efflux RND transporter periplasmic adaptor subunit [Chitinivorax sp. B]
MHTGSLWPGVLIVAAVALSGCEQAQEKQEQVRPVKSMVVRVGAVNEGASYSGEVRARYETPLGFRVGGKISSRLVQVGDMVTAGQVLARLDPQDLQLGVQAMRAQLAAAKADFDKARSDLDRYAHLLERKFISPAEFDQRRLLFEAARSRYDQAHAQFNINTNQAGYSELTADKDGVVTGVDAQAGQVVAPGQSVIRVARLDEKEVRVSVPESRVDELKQADKLTITLWADPTKQYEGKLRELAPDADPTTRTYAARVSLLNPDESVRLGMTANVMVARAGSVQAVRLPLSAVFQRSKQPMVWVIDEKTMKVKAQPITIGKYIDNDITVTAGLQNGVRVVTAGVTLLFENQPVKLLQEERS